MNRRFRNIDRSRGTTLIEVLAGLVILSTLLASVTIARGRFLLQWADADQKLAAVHEADHLLEQWLSGPPQAVPISSQGMTDDQQNHLWHTQVISSQAAQSLGSIVVRLQIYQRSTSGKLLTSVDFLLRDPRSGAR